MLLSTVPLTLLALGTVSMPFVASVHLPSRTDDVSQAPSSEASGPTPGAPGLVHSFAVIGPLTRRGGETLVGAPASLNAEASKLPVEVAFGHIKAAEERVGGVQGTPFAVSLQSFGNERNPLTRVAHSKTFVHVDEAAGSPMRNALEAAERAQAAGAPLADVAEAAGFAAARAVRSAAVQRPPAPAVAHVVADRPPTATGSSGGGGGRGDGLGGLEPRLLATPTTSASFMMAGSVASSTSASTDKAKATAAACTASAAIMATEQTTQPTTDTGMAPGVHSARTFANKTEGQKQATELRAGGSPWADLGTALSPVQAAVAAMTSVKSAGGSPEEAAKAAGRAAAEGALSRGWSPAVASVVAATAATAAGACSEQVRSVASDVAAITAQGSGESPVQVALVAAEAALAEGGPAENAAAAAVNSATHAAQAMGLSLAGVAQVAALAARKTGASHSYVARAIGKSAANSAIAKGFTPARAAAAAAVVAKAQHAEIDDIALAAGDAAAEAGLANGESPLVAAQMAGEAARAVSASIASASEPAMQDGSAALQRLIREVPRLPVQTHADQGRQGDDPLQPMQRALGLHKSGQNLPLHAAGHASPPPSHSAWSPANVPTTSANGSHAPPPLPQPPQPPAGLASATSSRAGETAGGAARQTPSFDEPSSRAQRLVSLAGVRASRALAGASEGPRFERGQVAGAPSGPSMRKSPRSQELLKGFVAHPSAAAYGQPVVDAALVVG